MAKLQKRSKGAVPTMDEVSSILTTPTAEVLTAPAPNPTPIQVIRNEPIELKPMNFKVPPEFKKEYKQFALDNDMKLVDVLKESFRIIKEMRK